VICAPGVAGWPGTDEKKPLESEDSERFGGGGLPSMVSILQRDAQHCVEAVGQRYKPNRQAKDCGIPNYFDLHSRVRQQRTR
jgi:hypothetical protein